MANIGSAFTRIVFIAMAVSSIFFLGFFPEKNFEFYNKTVSAQNQTGSQPTSPSTGGSATNDLLNLDQSQSDALNSYLQQREAQKQQRLQEQQKNAESAAAAKEQSNQQKNPLSGWMYVVLVIYLLTLLLVWIFLILAIISLLRWLKQGSAGRSPAARSR